MAKTPERGLSIHFINGTSLKVSFPVQAEDKFKRKLIIEELLKKRVLIIEAEGAIHFFPFENIKYMSIYPAAAADTAEFGVIKGARITE